MTWPWELHGDLFGDVRVNSIMCVCVFVSVCVFVFVCVCVGGRQLTGINSPCTSAWETDSCWYAKVERRGALGGYKEKKLATKLASS